MSIARRPALLQSSVSVSALVKPPPLGNDDVNFAALRDAMLDLLFVYGTLKRGFDHPMARLLEESAEFLGDATCAGRLYLVRHYPGLVVSDDAADRVIGQLFRLHEPRRTLFKLDDYEGCGPDAPPPPEYRREPRNVTLADGTVREAWVYLYNWPLDGLPRIEDSRFDLT